MGIHSRAQLGTLPLQIPLIGVRPVRRPHPDAPLLRYPFGTRLEHSSADDLQLVELVDGRGPLDADRPRFGSVVRLLREVGLSSLHVLSSV